MKTTAEQRLSLTVRQACELLGISRSTLLRLVARGDFPQPRRIGTKVLFDRAAVVEWWDKQETSEG